MDIQTYAILNKKIGGSSGSSDDVVDKSTADLFEEEFIPGIYDLGTRGGEVALYLNDTVSGLKLWHFIITGGENMSFIFATESGTEVTIKTQPSSFTSGTSYEVSILNNISIIA